MNSKIFVLFVLFLVISGTIARQCYSCLVCPQPFKGNEEGVSTINVGDDEYCRKAVTGPVISRDNGGSSCTPIGTTVFCCKGNLCNTAITTATLNIKLLAITAATFFSVRFFH